MLFLFHNKPLARTQQQILELGLKNSSFHIDFQQLLVVTNQICDSIEDKRKI